MTLLWSEFVTIDIAKKLKEKGFPQGNKDDITKLYYQISDNLQSAIMRSEGKDVKWYCASISEVLKWLRNEKNIICLPHIEPIEEKWFFYVVKLPQASDFPEYLSSVIYNTYEEAVLAGIEWVLNNLI